MHGADKRFEVSKDATDDYEFDAAIDGFGSYDDFEIGEYGS